MIKCPMLTLPTAASAFNSHLTEVEADVLFCGYSASISKFSILYILK